MVWRRGRLPQSQQDRSRVFHFLAPITGEFHGFLSDNATVNPDFYNWNMVFLMYCDGSSFAGNRVDPVDVLGNKIYMRYS